MASDVDRIKQHLDIVELVREYVELKPAGVNHKALCPFHQEKSPSFMVSRDRQTWHCFGCSEGGDMFSFIQKIEGVEFVDALKLLAKRANVELSGYDSGAASQRSRLTDCVDMAMKFYHKSLLESNEGAVARTYLEKRGVSGEMIEEFNIGYAPQGWNHLLQFLQSKRFSEDVVLRTGLAVRGNNARVYDRFRGRVMFPINDEHGRSVGCTGRVLESDVKEAKYVNTPQTELYDKGRIVYALDRAKHDIRVSGAALVMEGQMDVITAHQFGMRSAVATSGTALTDAQVQLLKRYATRFVFAFDADSAGVEAVKRAITLARLHAVDVRIVDVSGSGSKDPDDAIRADAVGFRARVEDAVPAMEFFLMSAVRGLDSQDVEAKKRAAAVVLPEIARLTNPVEQSHYLQRLATALSTDEDALHHAMKRMHEVRSARPSPTLDAVLQAHRATTEEYVLAALLGNPKLLATVSSAFDPDALAQEYQPLYIQMISLYSSLHHDAPAFYRAVLEALPESESVLDRLRFLGDELRESFNDASLALELQTWIANLSRIMLKRRLVRLESRIRELEQQPPASQQELESVIAEYSSMLSRLKQFDT